MNSCRDPASTFRLRSTASITHAGGRDDPAFDRPGRIGGNSSDYALEGAKKDDLIFFMVTGSPTNWPSSNWVRCRHLR